MGLRAERGDRWAGPRKEDQGPARVSYVTGLGVAVSETVAADTQPDDVQSVFVGVALVVMRLNGARLVATATTLGSDELAVPERLGYRKASIDLLAIKRLSIIRMPFTPTSRGSATRIAALIEVPIASLVCLVTRLALIPEAVALSRVAIELRFFLGNVTRRAGLHPPTISHRA